mgnify:CR=1 FL=1
MFLSYQPKALIQTVRKILHFIIKHIKFNNIVIIMKYTRESVYDFVLYIPISYGN